MFVHLLAGTALVDGAVPIPDTEYRHGWLVRLSASPGIICIRHSVPLVVAFGFRLIVLSLHGLKCRPHRRDHHENQANQEAGDAQQSMCATR